MKIAVSTTDGRTICANLGKCDQFLVFETDEFGIKGREMRRKSSASPRQRKEIGVAAMSLIQDCEAVICQGMGMVIYDGLCSAGIIPVITMETDAEAAVRQFISGGLPKVFRGDSRRGEN